MPEYAIPAVTDRDVYITRSFDAPIDVVWRFWTEPPLIARWFGPEHVTVDAVTVLVEPHTGGAYHLEMHDDAGVYPIEATILHLVEREYLELKMTSQTSIGELEDVVLRVQFHDHGDKTRITLHQGPFEPEARDLTAEGWISSFTKLDAILAQ